MKVLPVAWYDGFARVLSLVEDAGVWPDGLLDAYIALTPKTDGDATPLGQRPLIVFGPVLEWRSWRSGSSLGFLIRFLALVVVGSRLRLGMLLLLILKGSYWR